MSRRSWLISSAITLIFVAAYFVLRNLPDAQCGFLHYEIVERADGTVEFCATTHAGFLDLSRLDYPVKVSLDPSGGIEPWQDSEIELLLETSGGMPIAPHDLAVTHTKIMHLMLIDRSLTDYHHLHPVADGIGGHYRFNFTPKKPGPYRLMAEVVPVRTRRQVIASSTIDVQGAGESAHFSESRVQDEQNGLIFRLLGVPERMRTKRDYRLELQVSAEGSGVELETIMGAKAHMVAFDAAQRGFAHMHPIADIDGGGASEELAFLFNVPNPGWYRLFAQVQVGGQEVFGRFDLLVE
ncbi:hypothetical protein [Coraliomargarita akajimensis]|uniref:YtkA-like domain-containing protein n=1 Tax=Coraliomargarita akajimensis (strain DSM 45221 / IAM 15411 / JCM 23193 / KCTC 12865 / 04OKA010-24) TaxID=583355 RepID=D5EIK1_CORAD|nr:hypothetical protein [Coraliomargarita akajimensis]ADE54267.1 conserved hypothetical protein [Coraliomargarita akajimensis DSM 45221]